MEHSIIIPKHIAIIMDGNRRWASERGLPVLEGHRRVAGPVLEKLIEHAAKIGISYLTLWSFSTENWARDKREVAGIMQILRHGFKTYGLKMHRKGIRIRVIGDVSKFDTDIQKSLNDLVELTRNNARITVIFAINYGGRDEIIRATNKAISYQLSAISKKKDSNKVLSESWNLTTESFSKYLDTSGIPDPEFIIRTGAEQRLSGFLLWQSEYSELYFPDFYMPEFTPKRLDEAIEEFYRRKRRFGK